MNDPVDDALDALADEPTPRHDPSLEERLRMAHPGRRRSFPPLAAVGLIAAAMAAGGVSLAASGGLDGLRSWWYRIVIDGEEHALEVTGDGAREYEHVTPDGTAIRVRVERASTDDGGEKTRIMVTSQKRHGLSVLEDEHEVVVGRDPGTTPIGVAHPRAILGGAAPIHTWTDRGRRHTLTLIPGDGVTRVLIDDLDDPGPLPVRELTAIERPLGTLRDAALVEEAGAVRLTLRDGTGWEAELKIRTAPLPARPTRLETPDGRVQVEVH